MVNLLITFSFGIYSVAVNVINLSDKSHQDLTAFVTQGACTSSSHMESMANALVKCVRDVHLWACKTLNL